VLQPCPTDLYGEIWFPQNEAFGTPKYPNVDVMSEAVLSDFGDFWTLSLHIYLLMYYS